MSKATSLREPSMEEVLASIRRIIESGEEREVAREAGVAPPAASADASASVQPTAMVVPYRTVFDGAAAGAAESLRGTFDDQAETVVDEGAIDFGALADDEIAAALADFGNGNGNEQSTANRFAPATRTRSRCAIWTSIGWTSLNPTMRSSLSSRRCGATRAATCLGTTCRMRATVRTRSRQSAPARARCRNR